MCVCVSASLCACLCECVHVCTCVRVCVPVCVGASVPVALAALALLDEGPHQGVDDVGLVLLQPVARARDDVQAEVVADVEAAGLCHALLQEGVALAPQEQHRGAHTLLGQGQRAGDTGGTGRR